MKIDLRDIIKKEKKMRELPNNHRNSFEQRLTKELHQKPRNFYTFLKIAASFLILFSLGVGGYQVFKPDAQEIVVTEDKPVNKIIELLI